MPGAPLDQRGGSAASSRSTSRAGKACRGAIQAAVAMLLLMAPNLPSVAESLKLSSINDDRGHLGLGLLRAVEVVRGRYERAWALVSAPEPSAGDLDTALELLQANAKQWESLEPAVKLWTERELDENLGISTTTAIQQESIEDQDYRGSSRSSARSQNRKDESKSSSVATTVETTDASRPEAKGDTTSAQGPGGSETTTRIYDEAASLLAHNRAVLGQALARSGRTDRGIEQLEVACPEILEYQQNAQGRRDSKSWLHCYANLAEMYKTQKRFEEASSLLERMPWLPVPQQRESSTSGTPIGNGSSYTSDVVQYPHREAAIAGSPADDDISDEDQKNIYPAEVDGTVSESKPRAAEGSLDNTGKRSEGPTGAGITNNAAGAEKGNGNASDSVPKDLTDASVKDSKEAEQTITSGGTETVNNGTVDSDTADRSGKSTSAMGGRSDASPSRGAGAARVAGLNKAAAAASAAASAESAAAPRTAETSAEAEARRIVERHAEAMRASMNELAGELAVTTATRPMASQDWLDSRVVAAEEVLGTVRAGLLCSTAVPELAQASDGKTNTDSATEVSRLAVGVPGHADILREASHYLSAIKGVVAQGWSYVDNELQRMERHPAPSARPGFQSRREVIHTFRYLLMKARQYASENQTQATAAASSSQMGTRSRRKDRDRKASSSSKVPRKGHSGDSSRSSRSSSRGGADRSTSSNEETLGFFTFFVGAAFSLVAAALCSGARTGGPGRRKEVVRQRAATRAAKTVGSYVEPPQRGALATILAQTWANLKRSGMAVSSRATAHAAFAQKVCATAYADALECVRNAHDARFGTSGSSTAAGPRLTAGASSKRNGNVAAPQLQKQRSRKHAKKATPVAADADSVPQAAGIAETASTVDRTDAGVKAVLGSAPKVEAPAPAVDVARIVSQENIIVTQLGLQDVSAPGKGSESQILAQVGSAVADGGAAVSSPVADAEGTERNKSETGVAPHLSTQPSAASHGVALTSEEAVAAAVVAVAETAEAAVRLPYMTAEQVQAMVEEDERAWEQARQSGKKHSQRGEALLRQKSEPRSSLQDQAVHPKSKGIDGWSEVGAGGCARPRGNNGAGSSIGGGGGGRVLSMRNVRAVTARAERSSSPGSDPATTTSASSSDCSDASKENVNRPVSVGTSAGRHAGEGRTQHGGGKDTNLTHARSSSWTTQSSANRRGSRSQGISTVRAPRSAHHTGGSTVQSRARARDAGHTSGSRPSRVSYAPWAIAPAGSTPSARRLPNPRESRNDPRPLLVRQSASAPAGNKRDDRSPWETTTPSTAMPKTSTTTSKLKQTMSAVVEPIASTTNAVQHTVETSPKPGGEKPVESTSVEIPSFAAPTAWTNTALHPLGVQPEPVTVAPVPSSAPAPVPPREMTFPPPDHQQHWQRQQQRQQKQAQQQQHYHVLHAAESPTMPFTTATASSGPPPHEGGQFHPSHPPLLPPHPQHLAPLSRDMMVPQFLPDAIPEDSFQPRPIHVNGPGNGGGSGPAVLYHHSVPISSSSPAVSPGDVGGSGAGVGVGGQYHFQRDGSYESHSPGSNGGGGFSPEMTTVLAPPPQLMMLPPTAHDQAPQPGRFSPSIPLMQPNAEEGVPAPGMMPPMYGQPPLVQGPMPPPPITAGYHTPTGGVGVGAEVAGGGGALEALISAICWQVEYYFSVENLVKDVYLRNLMDGEGFVPVSKIIVFNRVRSMTHDMSLLVEAMRRSTELEILEQEPAGEVSVRTRYSPLHWVSSQVRAINAGARQPPSYAYEDESQPITPEGVHYATQDQGQFAQHESQQLAHGEEEVFVQKEAGHLFNEREQFIGVEEQYAQEDEFGSAVEGLETSSHGDVYVGQTQEDQCCEQQRMDGGEKSVPYEPQHVPHQGGQEQRQGQE